MLPGSARFVDERAIYSAGYRYEDLVRAVDVVATKPGYGIISECIANDTALLYTSRGRFVEYDVMVGRDAALPALRVHLERRPLRRPLGARAGRRARAACAAGASALWTAPRSSRGMLADVLGVNP